MPELLLEIGTEEIPASFLAPASNQLKEELEKRLKQAGLSLQKVTTVWTCRRLAVHVSGLPVRQADVTKEVQGPPVQVAFDETGKPTKTAAGFAHAKGITTRELEIREIPRGAYVFARILIPGRNTAELLEEMLPEVIRVLRFAKSMRWETGGLYFARPIRTIVALLDEKVLDFEVAGVQAGRKVRGHPFLGERQLEVKSAQLDAYQQLLGDNFVIVSPCARRKIIRAGAQELLAPLGSKLDELELLEEVTALVEYPTVVGGRFSSDYLDVPEPLLLEVLKGEQRFFPVRDSQGKLLPQFLAVCDRDRSSTGVIRTGLERVLGAKLADARFFWSEDRKVPLADKLGRLAGIVFHPQLGSYLDKARRLEKLAQFLGESLGLSAEMVSACRRAAKLCKVDLVSLTVREFPNLEGIMGREFACADGEPPEVADAIGQHYRPKSGDDELPTSLPGAIISIADKLDNLAGCFIVGLLPSGSQDPYGLRRDALGVIRIVLQKTLDLSLRTICEKAISLQPEGSARKAKALEDLFEFIRDRLYLLVTSQGYSHDLVRGTMKSGFDRLSDFQHRLEALTAIAKTNVWPGLVRAVERTYNISRELVGKISVDETLFATDTERRLWALYQKQKPYITNLIDQGRYQQASIAYAEAFDAPLHRFFEEVFVNVDNRTVRDNRQAMLKTINLLFSERIADLSEIIIPE